MMTLLILCFDEQHNQIEREWLKVLKVVETFFFCLSENMHLWMLWIIIQKNELQVKHMMLYDDDYASSAGLGSAWYFVSSSMRRGAMVE